MQSGILLLLDEEEEFVGLVVSLLLLLLLRRRRWWWPRPRPRLMSEVAPGWVCSLESVLVGSRTEEAEVEDLMDGRCLEVSDRKEPADRWNWAR